MPRAHSHVPTPPPPPPGAQQPPPPADMFGAGHACVHACLVTHKVETATVPQVYLHYAVKSSDDEVLFSTFSADDGSGIPQPFVLGKGMRMPRGWELGLQSKIKYYSAA